MMKRIEHKNVSGRSPNGKQNFLSRDSLFRTVVFATVIISLFPVLLYATVSYYRSRAQLQSLVANQLANITSIGAKQVEDFANGRKSGLDKLVGEAAFTTLLSQITTSTSQDSQSLLIQQFLSGPGAATSDTLFDFILVLDQDGKIIASSSAPWARSTFNNSSPSDHPLLSPWLSKDDASAFLFSPFPPFNDQFVLLTVRHFKTTGVAGEYTILGFSSAPLPAVVLKQAAGFFPSAQAYYYLERSGQLLTAGEETQLAILPNDPSVMAAITPAIQTAGSTQTLTYVSFNKTVVLAYVKKIPGLGLDLVLEVPTQNILGQIPILDVYNLLMILFAVIAMAGLAYLGTTQVVNPLLQLNTIAHELANGNFSQRTVMDRRDEIGQLSDSMNRLGDELVNLSSTMAGKVEQRTAQLKTAAEIASLAASFTNLEDVAEKTVNLINDRFNFYHTAIYLLDETGTGITLRDASGEIGIRRKRRARLMLLNETTITGEVALNNQARVVAELTEVDEILPDARSQAVVPISTASKVLGVLEVFGAQPNIFNADMLFVLQTLANQIAAALQNAHLLAPDQVNLEETAFLYTLTRQIIEANDEKAISELVLQALPLFPHTSAFLSFDQNNLRILGLYDPHTKKYEGLLSKIDIPTTNYYDEIAAGIPIFVQDITQTNNYDNVLSFFLRRGCKSAVIVPSLHAGKVVKLLILGFREDDYIHQDKLQPYFYLADVISTAYGRVTAMSQLQARISELLILASFSKATSLENDINQLFKILHDQVIRTIGSDIGFLIAIYNPKTNQIELPYTYENNNLVTLAPLSLGQGLISYVIEHKEPLLLVKDTEAKALELGAHNIGKPARSWMGIPLIVGNGLIGVLVFQDHQHEERFSETHLNLFMALAPQMASAIHAAQLAQGQREALDAYTKENQLVATWLTNTQDLVSIKNMHGQYLRASQVLLNAFAVTPETLMGKSDFDLLGPDAALRTTEEELLILSDRRPKLDLIEKTLLNGNDAWVTTSKIPIIEETGESSGMLTIRHDITELKHLEQEASRRAKEILTSAEIAREATSRLNIDELLEKTTQLISARFGFYHVAVFLKDPQSDWVVLHEATGDAGLQMKQDHYKLALTSQSIVAQAARKGQTSANSPVLADQPYERHPLLPETNAEIALPLKIGERILGVLDVHSTTKDAFNSDDDIATLSILADQLAIAVNNAEQFALTREMLSKHLLLHQITVAASISPSLEEALAEVTLRLVSAKVAERAAIFLLRPSGLELSSSHGYQETGTVDSLNLAKVLAGIAATQQKPVITKDATPTRQDEPHRSQMALPILFGEEVNGVLNLESNQPGAFGENDQEIMAALANNIATVIANWRLVNQIRSQVKRQEALFNATANIRRSIDIPTIMQTSVSEIGRAMGISSARITLVEDITPNSQEQDFHLNSQPLQPGKNGKAAGKNGKEATS
jgi:PAS domain S-box-containing protein